MANTQSVIEDKIITLANEFFITSFRENPNLNIALYKKLCKEFDTFAEKFGDKELDNLKTKIDKIRRSLKK